MISQTILQMRSMRPPQPKRALRDLCRLTVAATSDNEDVHLVRVRHGAPASSTLCGGFVSRHNPRRLFQNAGCAPCTDIALGDGHTFAQDRHGAMVNLERWSTQRGAPLTPMSPFGSTICGPVRVLVNGRWRDGDLESYEKERHGPWRGCVRWSEGLAATRLGWFGEHELAVSRQASALRA